MNFLLVKVFCVSAVILAITEVSNAKKDSKTCKDVISDLTKRQLGGIASCTKTMKFKNGKDKAAKTNCVLRCVMINEGLLDKEGKLGDGVMDSFVEKEFPDFLVDKIKPLFGKCATEHGAALDPSAADEFCKSYDGFIKCLMGTIGVMCN